MSMNRLNSILFEGAVKAVVAHTDDGIVYVTFKVTNRHFDADGNEDRKAAVLACYATGRLAQSVIDTCVGHRREVCIVGHLETDVRGRLVCRAEHVEFKPTKGSHA